MACENVSVNISIFYRLQRRKEEKKRTQSPILAILAYTPPAFYGHIQRFCISRPDVYMCVHYRAGKKERREKEEKPIVVLSSPTPSELLQAHSPFPHRFTYIRQSQTFLRAQFIAERPLLLHRYKASWCAGRIPFSGSNCHN